MTAFLFFIAFGLTAWLVSERLEGRARRDARQRNHQPHAWRKRS